MSMFVRKTQISKHMLYLIYIECKQYTHKHEIKQRQYLLHVIVLLYISVGKVVSIVKLKFVKLSKYILIK